MSVGNALATLAVQVAACLGVVVAAPAAVRPEYLPWLAVSLGMAGARLYNDLSLRRLLRHGASTRALRLRAMAHPAGLLISASVWAYLAWTRLPIEDAQQRYVVVVVLSALAGGATGVLAPLLWTGRAYVTLILVPACLQLIFIGETEAVLGVLGLVFWVVMIVGHRNNHALILRSIALASENRALLAQVIAQKDAVEDANRGLMRRVAERTAELKRKMIEAQAANRAKSQFLATMSHEVRTPLNGVIGMAEIMAHGELTPTQRERLAIIRTSADGLLTILNDVLEVARLESGHATVARAPFDAEAVVAELERLYRPIAAAKGLAFALEHTPGALGVRLGDTAKLQRILGNLISNAIKFTDRGEITLAVSANDDGIELTVSDTGPGIPEDRRAFVFERFTQLDSSATRAFGGTGLGLAICKELAMLLGGGISLQENPGGGAEFVVRLPFPAAEPSRDSAVAAGLSA